MGVTTIFPDMNFSRPASVIPRSIVDTVNDWQATQAFGSPAVWNRVGRYCQAHNCQMPSLCRVLSAGAPVAAEILSRMKQCISQDGEMHTPYGATEALPVASISATDVSAETVAQTNKGAGVCVGNRFPGIEWKVIQISDGPIGGIDAVRELQLGDIGELIVRGQVVTTEYVARPEATHKAKIQDFNSQSYLPGQTLLWHRMGDVGYLDSHDRFWFCGRMSQRVTTSGGPMFTIPCEAIFNSHPDVFRSALVGIGEVGRQLPAIVVEPLPGRWPRRKTVRDKLIDELSKRARLEDHTKNIYDVLLQKSLPVDVRHNVKINRELLAKWAARKLRVRIK